MTIIFSYPLNLADLHMKACRFEVSLYFLKQMLVYQTAGMDKKDIKNNVGS